MYRLRITEYNDEETALIQSDRYFGPLSEVLSRLCYPWLDGIAFAVYQKQSDGTWLLYYHSINS
jgi:hypothetical protein